MAMDPVHAALLHQMLGGGGPPGAGGPPGLPLPPPGAGGGPPPPNGKVSPLQGVQSVIQDLHDLMRILPDPGAVSIAATCLKAMTGLQQQLMQPAGKGGGPGGPG
jgi:hypothetical protein